ncbi:flagellar hook-associated protein FlgK [Peribacillus asahii]|uniref:flagellar hook-associated protein FlgK n=1 Tax=Peribacillus asahii TaxID=228899 RepID=UPI003819127B
MISTFMGLETSKRGMSIAQNALYTTGHNVANANTPGYSRQRVNLNPSLAFPSPGLNSPKVPGQLGTGVEAGSIQRIRDSFLDTQYRSQNSKVGYYGSLSESLSKMEEIMNDPTDSGLLKVMNNFWNALQDITVNTDNAGARAVVSSAGTMVADTLNYYYNSLTNVQKDIGFQIGAKEKEINAIIANINSINESIAKIEPNGYIPNDLYDERDMLVDELSNYMNIKVTRVMPEEYGIADRAVATGLYNIELVKTDGSSYDSPINLVGASADEGLTGYVQLEISPKEDGEISGPITGIEFVATAGINGNDSGVGGQLNEFTFSGELVGLIESYGYENESGEVKGRYPEMLEKLNNMTRAFAEEFNKVHSEGYYLDGDGVAQNGGDFFEDFESAGTIKVNADIIKDPSKIALAEGADAAASDNKNAHTLAAIQFKNFSEYDTPPEGLSGNLDTYYAGIIGNLGVDSLSVQKDYANATTLAASVENNRQSVSAVSLDEEMTDMIKFQQSYNASARMVTLVDEMLDKIINGMGVVGR